MQGGPPAHLEHERAPQRRRLCAGSQQELGRALHHPRRIGLPGVHARCMRGERVEGLSALSCTDPVCMAGVPPLTRSMTTPCCALVRPARSCRTCQDHSPPPLQRRRARVAGRRRKRQKVDVIPRQRRAQRPPREPRRGRWRGPQRREAALQVSERVGVAVGHVHRVPAVRQREREGESPIVSSAARTDAVAVIADAAAAARPADTLRWER